MSSMDIINNITIGDNIIINNIEYEVLENNKYGINSGLFTRDCSTPIYRLLILTRILDNTKCRLLFSVYNINNFDITLPTNEYILK